MKKLGLILISIGVIIFYLCFFLLAPYLSGALPNNDWKHFLEILIYIAVGWGGGIALPFAFIIYGVIFIFSD